MTEERLVDHLGLPTIPDSELEARMALGPEWMDFSESLLTRWIFQTKAEAKLRKQKKMDKHGEEEE